MRYIRTGENKIITYDESAASLNQPIILNYPAIFADTIEDLCDEFVVVARKGDGSHTFVADSKRIATWNARPRREGLRRDLDRRRPQIRREDERKRGT